MRSQQSRRLGQQYPNPFFDLSLPYIPPSIRAMFPWCRVFFSTFSDVRAVIEKKVAYVMQDLIFSTKGDRSEQVWRDLFNDTIDFRTIIKKLLYDRETYGNAFASIHYPFQRYLVCPSCGKKNLSRQVSWRFEAYKFLGDCPAEGCGAKRVIFSAVDKPIKNRKQLRIIRWPVMFMEISHNPITGKSEYIYRIPQHIRDRISDPNTNKVMVDGMPMVILNASEKGENIRFHPDNIFHFKAEGVSGEDESWGIPPLLAGMKDLWLLQTYKRAQEAIAAEHVLPLTVLSPGASPGQQAAPHMAFDLSQWKSETGTTIRSWRRDPNSIHLAPFPFTVQNLRGDAQALNIDSSAAMARASVMTALGVTPSFIDGGLNYSSASVSLRTLENTMQSMISDQQRFIDWAVERIRQWGDLPPIEVRLADFKLADDVQQKSLVASMRQMNVYDDQTTIEEMGGDYEKIQERRKRELEQRLQEIEKMSLAQAATQAKTLLLEAEAQAHAQVRQQEIALEGQLRLLELQMKVQQAQAAMAPQPTTPGQESDAINQQAAQTYGVHPGALTSKGQMAPKGSGANPRYDAMLGEMYAKVYDPQQLELELSTMDKSNPARARAIRQYTARSSAAVQKNNMEAQRAAQMQQGAGAQPTAAR
jgi:hypothetical protein